MHESDPSQYSPAIVISETRIEHLLRTGKAAPRFLQGIFPFAGRGVFDAALLDDSLLFRVPEGKTASVIYFRAGNLSDDLIYLTLSADETHVRYFPVGPRADFHVPLAIVEPYAAGTRIAVCYAAPRGLTGTVVVDVGMIETDGVDRS